MPYDNIIDRSGAAALIPEDAAREIIQGATEQSAVLRLARRLADMPRNQRRMPVLSALPTAYFVNGDTGLKQTSEMQWGNKFLDAEEIAVIFPIPEAVLDDADYDIWGEVRPRAVEAIGQVIDRAILFDENAPASWPDAIATGATAAGHVITEGSGDDLYDDILGDAGLISLIEVDGFMANGHIAQMGMRGKLRNVRTSEGAPIFTNGMQGASSYALDGEPIIFPRNGSMVASDDVLMFTGDWSQLVYSMRQDITFKLLDQAVIQGPDGSIIYNLPQQDMVALRAVIRLAWQLPNPISRLNTNEATRYPFAVLEAAGS